ncbi:MAG TPA: N-acyl homoserine lactonase family protein [Steroidobacteraceae bacterium]|nr:N-acyl homoserine lactonase family protein [Steroidobacteraceae bacterium]
MSVTLRAFTCGWLHLPVSFFIEGGEETLLRAPVPAYLIEHPKGRVLFDTGLTVRARRLLIDQQSSAGRPNFEFDEGTDIAARLRAVDIDPARIDWIVNSHLHSDHCGGNEAIPNASVVIQHRELVVARAQAGSMLYDDRSFETGQPFLGIDGEHDLFGDGRVTVFPTYGHTPGHQSMRVSLASGNVILAGDCCYLKRSLDELRTSPADVDKEQAAATLRRLRALKASGARIFYGHDGVFWKDVAQGVALC